MKFLLNLFMLSIFAIVGAIMLASGASAASILLAFGIISLVGCFILICTSVFFAVFVLSFIKDLIKEFQK